MVRAVDKTLQEGLHAKLPPHLSTLLGLSNEKECLVMQGVVRTGRLVQGFDVSTTNKNDVVLFVANETTNNQTLYLTSKEGALRKVVTVEEGVGQVRKITSEDRKAFEKEKQFWFDRLAPVAPPLCTLRFRPLRAAALSLILWAGLIVTGRLIAF